MDKVPGETVFHGTDKLFDQERAIPRLNRRVHTDEKGEQVVHFEKVSFHATPHRWIALAYTYTENKSREVNGETYRYNMGVSLYENTKQVAIYGFGSLEESLSVLYGDGGYLYHFNGNDFYYTEGLGNLEVIVENPTEPMRVERIDNPVEEMKKEGVTFHFFDLSLPENKI